MFSDDFVAGVGDGSATVECRGLRWTVTGWLDVPEIAIESDEARFAGPAAGDPGVWLELRHSFDRTWQVRLSAVAGDWADWPGVEIALTHIGPVARHGLAGTGGGLDAPTQVSPVWSWHLGAEGWLLVADGYDDPVLFGNLRRGVATDTSRGLVVPPARLEPNLTRVTAWSMQELSSVPEAHAQLPIWLPSVTGVGVTSEVTLTAPDHGLAHGPELTDTQEDGTTLLTMADTRGGITEVLLHGARGTVTLPLAFGANLAESVPALARELVERTADAEELAADVALLLSVGASAGVAGASQLLTDLPIRTTGGAEQPLVVGTCAMELARTGDPLWAGRLAGAVEYLPAVPGAVSALVRAVVGTFAVNGDPQVYLDRIADLEAAVADGTGSTQDGIVALEVAAVGGWVQPTLVERVAGLLGWGMPLSPVLPVDPRTAVQAIAALSLVDESVVAHWAISPTMITAQALRWILAGDALPGSDGADATELMAWLLLPVTE